MILLATSVFPAIATAVDGSDPVQQRMEVLCTSAQNMQVYLGELTLETMGDPYTAVDLVNKEVSDPHACMIRTARFTEDRVATRMATPKGVFLIYKVGVIATVIGGEMVPTFGKERYMYISRKDTSSK